MERDWIAGACNGDEAAFRRLVEAYGALAWRTARVLSPDAASAEDAVQEAWLDAWRGLPRFDHARPFRPWLLTLVANRCRKAGRRRAPPRVALDDPGAAALAAPEDALGVLLRREAAAAVRAAVAALPPEQRRALDLRYFADLELAEIALVTGAPLGTVKSRLHRALGALRAQWPSERLAAVGGEED